MSADTFIHRLTDRLAADPARTVFIYEDGAMDAGAVLSRIQFHARALAARGIGRGTLLSLFAPTAPDAICLRYAASLLGAATCYLSAPPSAAMRAALIAKIAPTLLVVFPQTRALLPPGLDVPVRAVGDCGPDLARLDQDVPEGDDIACQALPEDLGVIHSSGGSTGLPKGSCRDFATYSRMVDGPPNPARRQLVNGRLAYLSGVMVDATLLGGGTVVLRDGFSIADTLAQIESQRITDLFLVEPQLFELMDDPALADTDISSLRMIVHIGASAPAVLRQRARARLGAVVAHPYGASEQGVVTFLSPAEHDPGLPERFTSAGRLVPGVDLRLRKADGTLAATGEPGLIETRPANMAQSYRHQPDLSTTAFADGWYHSGDMGVLDAAGYLHVLGRADDITGTGDALVTSTGLEDTLCRLPGVRYAVVVLDRDSGRRVAAVEPWPGGEIDRDACTAALAEAYGAEVADATAIIPLPRVPRTEQGKPDRQAIKELGAGA
ncbi:fatty acid CoA ligase [Azorhizobium oxalatiphilum]|uniref:Fatty acid CoA ligase n=1 Tax=Azorhizobium oxalatiphilum TaxID=980631 RepID=A0A917C629_9HYPH|nr:AMP-binding protein [Azorhizobium oxalatiphilum]GGF73766.1 fatty acid CoA ligase [Azorhizobium oxalatiphilum]